jgi:hypothetical protein
LSRLVRSFAVSYSNSGDLRMLAECMAMLAFCSSSSGLPACVGKCATPMLTSTCIGTPSTTKDSLMASSSSVPTSRAASSPTTTVARRSGWISAIRESGGTRSRARSTMHRRSRVPKPAPKVF